MKLSTAVWHILQGKPITDKALLNEVVNILRSTKGYDSPILDIAKTDYTETLDPKLEKYAEDYRRSPNQSGTIDPQFIILHHSSGSFKGTISWILQKISKVSYHYVIDPTDGTRIQHVFDKKKAWHAGKSIWKNFKGLNGYSIGISFAGDTHKREVADFEIDSCTKKILYLVDKFPKMQGKSIEEVVLTHAMIAPNRKNDTSEEVRQRVIERYNQLIS